MITQLDIPFPSESPINTERLSRQNKIVADHLLSGKSINVVTAIREYSIYHLHSRIADCRREFRNHRITIYSKSVTIEEMQCKEYNLKPFTN